MTSSKNAALDNVASIQLRCCQLTRSRNDMHSQNRSVLRKWMLNRDLAYVPSPSIVLMCSWLTLPSRLAEVWRRFGALTRASGLRAGHSSPGVILTYSGCGAPVARQQTVSSCVLSSAAPVFVRVERQDAQTQIRHRYWRWMSGSPRN